ncbi:unnamed protein product, partial [marine sediment metagenome]
NTMPLGIAVAVDSDTGFYFFNPRDEMLREVVGQTPTIITHNAAFDLPILKRLSIKVNDYEDTMLLAYSAGILDKSLADLSFSILHRSCPSVTSQWKKKDQGNIAIDHVKMGQMSIIHACNTYMLWDKLPKTTLYRDIDRPSIDLVMEMEHWGLLIDQVMLTEVEQATVVKANQMELELKAELGDINLASNPQVVVALQAKGILGTRKTRGGAESVSKESLSPLNHPVTNKFLKWKSLGKTLSTYIPAFRSVDASGRIHTVFGYTNTGRWKSGDKKQGKPNLQNITRDERFQDLEDSDA